MSKNETDGAYYNGLNYLILIDFNLDYGAGKSGFGLTLSEP